MHNDFFNMSLTTPYLKNFQKYDYVSYERYVFFILK